MGAAAHHRPIRSFVRREGRLTSGQARALEQQWPRYGADRDSLANPAALFERVAPITLEIGFGDGDNLLAQAIAHPERNFIGLEVHRPGVGRLLAGAAEAGLGNLRVSDLDAAELLRETFPAGCLSATYVLFPDPWHKARHHKRRLVQAGFLDDLAKATQPGGLLRLATDWENYAEHMQAVCEPHPAWRHTEVPTDGEQALDRIQTKFERRGLRLGHGVWDFALERV